MKNSQYKLITLRLVTTSLVLPPLQKSLAYIFVKMLAGPLYMLEDKDGHYYVRKYITERLCST